MKLADAEIVALGEGRAILRQGWLGDEGRRYYSDKICTAVAIETSDGRRVICRPGDLIFAEDRQGKGHITRSLRDTRGFVHVVMPEDFDITLWPLADA